MSGRSSNSASVILLVFLAATIAGVLVTFGSDGFSQSATTVIAITRMEIGQLQPTSNSPEQAKAPKANGPS